MLNDISVTAEVCIWGAKEIRWTEDRLTKLIDYLRQSKDKEKYELIDSLKKVLYYGFKDDAIDYFKQIDLFLSSSIGGEE